MILFPAQSGSKGLNPRCVTQRGTHLGLLHMCVCVVVVVVGGGDFNVLKCDFCHVFFFFLCVY